MLGDLRGIVASRTLISLTMPGTTGVQGRRVILKRSRCIAISLKATHLLSGTLRNLLQDNGQVELHHAVDEEQVCSMRPCGQATMGGLELHRSLHG